MNEVKVHILELLAPTPARQPIPLTHNSLETLATQATIAHTANTNTAYAYLAILVHRTSRNTSTSYTMTYSYFSLVHYHNTNYT